MIRRAAGAAAAACLLVPALAGASSARPPVSLTASPAQLTLIGNSRAAVDVTNSGSDRVVVDVALAGFALDVRGRPRIVARAGGTGTSAWLSVRPRHLTLGPGGVAPVTVTAKPPLRATPGDHDALVLLTTRPRRNADLAVRMRLGIVVAVRVPGTVVRRLQLRGLRVDRVGDARVLELLVANRGNVTETLDRRRLTVTVLRGGIVFARLRSTPRALLPRTSGIAEIPYRGRLHGWVEAVVRVAPAEPGGGAVRRTFWIRV